MLFSRVREDGHGEFFYPHREARMVHVTGSFSGWKTPGTPLRLAKEWVEVARLYATKGVRYDIGYDVGIEWREGGMRVWIGDTAYDSAPMTPGAPNNVSE